MAKVIKKKWMPYYWPIPLAEEEIPMDKGGFRSVVIDSEKVIKGLQEISDYFFDIYHHSKDREEIDNAKDRCDAVENALALLKEQYETIKELQNAYDYLQKQFFEAQDKLLKEQEAVKPKYNARTNWYECGACHYSMTSGMHCRSELIPAYKVGFCAKCGRAVEWSK